MASTSLLPSHPGTGSGRRRRSRVAAFRAPRHPALAHPSSSRSESTWHGSTPPPLLGERGRFLGQMECHDTSSAQRFEYVVRCRVSIGVMLYHYTTLHLKLEPFFHEPRALNFHIVWIPLEPLSPRFLKPSFWMDRSHSQRPSGGEHSKSSSSDIRIGALPGLIDLGYLPNAANPPCSMQRCWHGATRSDSVAIFRQAWPRSCLYLCSLSARCKMKLEGCPLWDWFKGFSKHWGLFPNQEWIFPAWPKHEYSPVQNQQKWLNSNTQTHSKLMTY